MLTEEQLRSIHALASHQRESLANDTQAGCFFCERIFDPKEIKEWARSGPNGSPHNDAICTCGIDAVLGANDLKKAGYELTKELLAEMGKYYFGEPTHAQEDIKLLFTGATTSRLTGPIKYDNS